MSLLAFGHRGAAAHAPENTLASFAEASRLGADGVELDVQLSADKQLVVFHDDQLERVTNGRGALAEHTLAELQSLDAGSWFSPRFAAETIPTLSEVFEALAGTALQVNVELKHGPRMSELVDATLAVVRDAGARAKVVYSSFDFRALRLLRERDPDAAIGVLFVYGGEEKALQEATRLSACNIHPPTLSASADLVAQAHAEGRQVWVWTANEASDIDRLVAAGVDAIMSDYPDRVVARRH